MTHTTQMAELRANAALHECPIIRRANAVLDVQVAKDADHARRFLDAQPVLRDSPRGDA